MKPSKVERDLRYVSTNSPSPQELGSVDIRKLLSLGLVRKTTNTKINFHNPPGTPRWATKYRFTRRKYGVTESNEINENYVLTSKGRRRLRNLVLKRLRPEEPEEKEMGEEQQK